MGTEEIEMKTKSLPRNKSPSPDEFSSKSFENIKEDLLTIIFRLFQENKATETLPESFYDTTITLIPKADRLLNK